MADNQVKIDIIAAITGLTAGLKQASSQVQNFAEETKSRFESLGSVFETFNKLLLGFTAVLAGGRAFKEAIESTERLTEEARVLARAFGISTEAASGINQALDAAGLSTQEYIGAAQKLNRQVRTNEQTLNDLGLQTRDASGALKSQQDLMGGAIAVLREYKEGTDRNLVAQALFGRGVEDTSKLLRLTREEFEEGAQDAQDLALVVGEEDVEAWHHFHKAVHDAGDVVDGLWKAIADALRPVLMDLAVWFRDIGPAVISVTKLALEGLSVILSPIGDAISFLGEVLGPVWEAFKILAEYLWDTVKPILGWLYETVATILSDAFSSLGIVIKAVAVIIVAAFISIKDGFQELELLLGTGIAIIISQFNTWAEVANRALHLDWAGAKRAYQDGMKDIDSILEEASKRQTEIVQKNYSDFVTIGNKLFPGKIASSQHGGESEASAGTKEATGLIKKDKEKTEEAKQQDQLAALAVARNRLMAEESIKIEGIKNKELLELSQITNEEYLRRQLELQQRLNDINIEAAERKRAAIKEDVVEAAKAENDLLKTKQEATIKEMALRHQITMEAQKDYLQLSRSINSSLESSFNSVITGAKSMKDAFKDFSNSVADEIAKIASKNLTHALFGGMDSGGGGIGGWIAGLINPGSGTGSTSGGFGSLFSSIGNGISSFASGIGSLFGFKDGGTFLNGNVTRFATGGIVTMPTLFPMANGDAGMMGEAGPEGILPLTRLPGGKLGVHAAGSGGTVVNMTVNTPDSNSFRKNSGQIIADMQAALRRSQRNL